MIYLSKPEFSISNGIHCILKFSKENYC